MSVTSFYNTPSKLKVTPAADLKIRDCLSLYAVGSIITLNDFSGLGISQLAIQNALDILVAESHLKAIKGTYCNRCESFFEDDTDCGECGNPGLPNSAESAFRVTKPIVRSDDSLWPESKYIFEDLIQIFFDDGSSIDAHGKIIESEIRFCFSLENYGKPVDHFKRGGQIYYPVNAQIFRPEYGATYRHYSSETTKLEAKIMQNNSYVYGSNNNVNQSINNSSTDVDELKSVLEQICIELAKSGQQNHDLYKRIEAVKSAPRDSLVTKCKDLALTLQSSFVILGTNGPELLNKFIHISKTITG